MKDHAEGFGLFAHLDGEKYEGMWKRDKTHGNGKFMFKDG